MKGLHHHVFLSLLFSSSSSNAFPVDGPPSTLAPSEENPKIIKSTTHSDGSVIDWIAISSQTPDGVIASPPAPLEDTQSFSAASNESTAEPWALLQTPGEDRGPKGTVPILRYSPSITQASLTKGPPVSNQDKDTLGTQAVGDHWYASSAQHVDNHGGSAFYSLYKAWTESSGDFSLLQAAVIRTNVPKPGANSQLVMQTVEAGWINYPAQGASPHLFTFFTTDGYSSTADDRGGWNRDVRGWVQYDSTIFPGSTFAPLSTRNGAQYDIRISWFLSQGNWWLWVLDRWIGYYPASLFSANTDASRSLATGSNQINYYGEIYDSHPSLTRTDMGSGEWPEAGQGRSAYIRNMLYRNTADTEVAYDGSRDIVVSDTNRYRMNAQWNSGSSWGSYMYLGGPGAGGVVDG